MRQGFGLPQVLLIILFIGGIVSVTMKYTSLGAQHYADSYTREQAELFLQSATEEALLHVSGHSRSGNNCLQYINITSPDQRFDANITINKYYFSDGTGCTQKDSNNNDINETIQTQESNGMIDMTVIVTSKDPKTNPSLKLAHQVRLMKRSLQRP